MIDGLKPYLAIKDSVLPSLGEIPEHWSERRAKYFYRESEERSVLGDEELLSVSHKTGVTPRKQNVTMFLAESTVGYKVCQPGDVAINTMWAFMGALGIARQVGLVSPAYSVYRPQHIDALNPEYLDRLLRIDAYKSEYICRSTGINSSRLRLYPEEFLRIPILCPPPAEQLAIVRFLDHADRAIRRSIHAKQKLIKLLEEQITARASVAMRHSDCTNQRLGRVAVEHIRAIEREDSQTYIALGLYNRGRGIFRKPPTLGAELGDSEFSWVESGDLVISGQFAWEGAVALAGPTEKRTIVSHRYYLLRGIKGLTTAPYLWALLRSDYGAMLLDHHSRGAAGRNRPLNLRTLLKEQVPVPPYELQLAVDDELATTAPLRIQAAHSIEVLQEYRTRLIADVVTGKLDVREAAARLPEEVMNGVLTEDLGEQDLENEGDEEDVIDKSRS
jgi:type I restriction enzyme S subunit